MENTHEIAYHTVYSKDRSKSVSVRYDKDKGLYIPLPFNIDSSYPDQIIEALIPKDVLKEIINDLSKS